MNLKFFLLAISYLLGLVMFLNGFLLTRRVILRSSTGIIPSSVPIEFEQVILIVIDALRYDFIKPSNASLNKNYINQMPFIQHLLQTRPEQSILLRSIADPPTTTLQRLKGLTTGTLPTFIDVSYNFIGYQIEEDNILNQMEHNLHPRAMSLLGDDTWLALYPSIKFKHLHVYPSFDVHDLDTVDNGILEYLWTVIEDSRHENLSLIIAHFLGVDHCGHRYGPLHVEMKRKLNQMDDVIRNISLSFDASNASSLVIVIGDHGMTQNGDHGGDELNEIETAMFIYTNKPNYFSSFEARDEFVSQIDLVPTISWFLHSLIPFSSLGMMIIDVIPVEQRYISMKLNFEQIESYLEEISMTISLSDKLQELRADLRTIFVTLERERNLTRIEYLFNQFKSELQAHFRLQWSTFNVSRIIFGIILMTLSCAILIIINVNSLEIYNIYENRILSVTLTLMSFLISFSNSFIINEAMCLYFLIETLILMSKTDLLNKFLLSFVLFLTRAFLICREEQQPYCVDSSWLVSKFSDNSDYFLPLVAGIFWLLILHYVCTYSYFLPYLSFIGVLGSWYNIPHSISFFYLTLISQISFILVNLNRVDTLIYSIVIFVVGYRFSFVIFLQYFIYFILLNSNNQPRLAILPMLGDYFFYATGHQPVLSQIRWVAAFPAATSSINVYLSMIMNSLIVRGIFILIETFSCQILNVLFIRKFIPQRNQTKLIRGIFILDCNKLIFTAISVFLLRRHLMLWKIFCPRLLFQLVGFIVKWLFMFVTIKI